MCGTNILSQSGCAETPRLSRSLIRSGRNGACAAPLLFALGALAVACAAPPPRAGAPTPGGAAELEVRVVEVIERADLDGLSYAKVYVAGHLEGQTEIAPRSRAKAWHGAVGPGNHPVRVELWVLPGTGSWRSLPEEDQPRERFVRVAPGMRAVLALLRHPGGRYDFEVTQSKEGR